MPPRLIAALPQSERGLALAHELPAPSRCRPLDNCKGLTSKRFRSFAGAVRLGQSAAAPCLVALPGTPRCREEPAAGQTARTPEGAQASAGGRLRIGGGEGSPGSPPGVTHHPPPPPGLLVHLARARATPIRHRMHSLPTCSVSRTGASPERDRGVPPRHPQNGPSCAPGWLLTALDAD